MEFGIMKDIDLIDSKIQRVSLKMTIDWTWITNQSNSRNDSQISNTSADVSVSPETIGDFHICKSKASVLLHV